MGTSRLALVAGLAALAVTSVLEASASRSAALTLPLPSAGNVSISRLTLAAGAGRAGTTPRLSIGNARAVAKGTVVVATVSPSSVRSRFVVTIAAIRAAAAGGAGADAPALPTIFTLRVPPSFRLVAAPQSAKDVLYQNRAPSFPIARGGTESVLAGEVPGKLPAARVGRDAQLLAFDRAVPLADMELLGLPFVTVQAPTGRKTVPVVVGLSRLNQVNAVQVRFPADLRVVHAAGPEGTSSSIVSGGTVQLTASTASFQEGVPYTFTLNLSRPLKRGEAVTVRASTHYFESALPFTERFFLF